MNEEASNLFEKVWFDELPVQIFADWLREMLSAGATRINAVVSHDGANIWFIAEKFYGGAEVTKAILKCPKCYWESTKNFTLETITTPAFVDWLTEAMDKLFDEPAKWDTE